MKLARITLLVFALLLLVGGIMAMVKAESIISLVACVIGAGLLLYSRWLWSFNHWVGFAVGILTSLALSFRSVKKLLDGQEVKPMPDMFLMGLIVLAILLLLVGLCQARKTASATQEESAEAEAAADETGKVEAEEAEDPEGAEEA